MPKKPLETLEELQEKIDSWRGQLCEISDFLKGTGDMLFASNRNEGVSAQAMIIAGRDLQRMVNEMEPRLS